MCVFEFGSLFDRVGADPETSMHVAAAWGSGDEDTGPLARVSQNGVGAAHMVAHSGGAASTPVPASFRPVAFGTLAKSASSMGPVWPVLVTCSECGSRLRFDAVGYRQAVKRLTAQGWRYTARPVETAECPECLPPAGEGELEMGGARRPRTGPAARDARSARPDRTPPSGMPGRSGLARGAAR